MALFYDLRITHKHLLEFPFDLNFRNISEDAQQSLESTNKAPDTDKATLELIYSCTVLLVF